MICVKLMGAHCSMKTYSMSLIEDGCYIFYEHGSLTLFQSPQDVYETPIIIEHLMQLGNILQSTLQNIDTRALSSDTTNNAPVCWKRQSSGTPLRTNENNEMFVLFHLNIPLFPFLPLTISYPLSHSNNLLSSYCNNS